MGTKKKDLIQTMHNKTELQTGYKKVIVNIMIYYESKLYTACKKRKLLRIMIY